MTKEIPKWLQGTVARLDQKAVAEEGVRKAIEGVEISVLRERYSPLLREIIHCCDKWKSLEVDRIFEGVAIHIFDNDTYTGGTIEIEPQNLSCDGGGRDHFNIDEFENHPLEMLEALVLEAERRLSNCRVASGYEYDKKSYEKRASLKGAHLEASIGKSSERDYDNPGSFIIHCPIRMDKNNLTILGTSVPLNKLQTPQDLERKVGEILSSQSKSSLHNMYWNQR